jgi:hypothetical protein
MKNKWIIFFIRSAGILLIITAAAKLISTAGSARILQQSDPIVSISFRTLLLIVSTLELITAFICLFSKRIGLQASLVAWLATNFVLYRCALWETGYKKPCSCLGNLTDALHIATQTADTTMKIILCYLLLGSFATLFYVYRKKQKFI